MKKARISETTSAADYLPENSSIESLRAAAQNCQGCPLYIDATQTVFGEGDPNARVILVGEQPGDQEDKQGRPFVGPAGKLLDQAMQEANLNREDTYLTNAVKHFKYEWKGKRRLHQKPRLIEVHSCLPWLHAEIQQVAPEIIVCLGATAAQSLLGNSFRITRDRGKFFQQEGLPWIITTMHPSSILRAPDEEQRQEQKELLIADLKLVVDALIHGLPDTSSNKAG